MIVWLWLLITLFLIIRKVISRPSGTKEPLFLIMLNTSKPNLQETWQCKHCQRHMLKNKVGYVPTFLAFRDSLISRYLYIITLPKSFLEHSHQSSQNKSPMAVSSHCPFFITQPALKLLLIFFLSLWSNLLWMCYVNRYRGFLLCLASFT